MANVWQAPESVMESIRDLIANFHPHLASVDRQILVLFREKASKAGGVVKAGKAGKANSQLAIVSDIDWKFTLEIADDEWRTYTNTQRVALLDHLLCACRVEEDEETHELKCFIAPPDVVFYAAEVERHGWWRVKGSPKEENLILELFGPDASKV